jgi:tight adherence protein B
MPWKPEQSIEFIIAAAAFALVFCIWLVVILLLSIRGKARARKIEERLGFAGAPGGRQKVLSLWLDDRMATTIVPGSEGKSLLYRLERLRMDAGWDSPAGTILGCLLAASAFVLIALFLLTESALPGLGITFGVWVAFWFYLNHCVNRRRAIFERQFVDALDLASRSLRAGHPLVGAFRLISEEIPPPVSTVFFEISQKQALGQSLEAALQSVAAKSVSADLKLFAASVIIQLRSGGNLAEMMDRLAFVIRDRMRLSRRIRVLTAQTQFSKRVLLTLPFMLFFVLNFIRPSYMVPLYGTTTGRILLAISALGLFLGAWTMNRMAVLRY